MARMSLSLAAETDDVPGVPARGLEQSIAMRRRLGDDRGSVGLETLEDLALGVGDRLNRAEVLDMRRCDGGDERDVRTDHARERRDLAGIVHAHFEHREQAVARHSREAQRHAGMVVVAFDRAVHVARVRSVERREKGLLGAGLADRAGDPDDLRRSSLASGPAQRFERCGDVVDQHVGLIEGAGYQRARRAGRESLVEEMVAVMDGARHGDEQVALADLAAVEGDAGDCEVGVCVPAGRRRDLR